MRTKFREPQHTNSSIMTDSFKPEALSATLAIQIADQLGIAITEERLQPGERVREVELAKRFNVSRATLRDALRLLESRGLVRILPQRGAQVTLLSSQELQDLFEIRSTLLALASRKAAKNFKPEDKERLRRGLTELQNSQKEPNEYARASAHMVQLIAALSRNAQLTAMIESFAQRIGRYARLGLVTQKRRNRSMGNWTKLVAAISAGDDELAETIHRQLALENGEAAMMEITARAANARKTE